MGCGEAAYPFTEGGLVFFLLFESFELVVVHLDWLCAGVDSRLMILKVFEVLLVYISEAVGGIAVGQMDLGRRQGC